MTLIPECNNIPSSAQIFAVKSDTVALTVALGIFVITIVTLSTASGIDADTLVFTLGFVIL